MHLVDTQVITPVNDNKHEEQSWVQVSAYLVYFGHDVFLVFGSIGGSMVSVGQRRFGRDSALSPVVLRRPVEHAVRFPLFRFLSSGALELKYINEHMSRILTK
ncbi:hypothetical protein TNCV_4724401 [Trichonephila clavipes]|uniref:Uncharacterized protein n=1 Tax=Trichonephila clavipes TaxID=2585209 RepID=A0A8X7BGA9_TRICX|nr:hypothetical protein TNCV_4724401 [Trichonephila clavipes]